MWPGLRLAIHFLKTLFTVLNVSCQGPSPSSPQFVVCDLQYKTKAFEENAMVSCCNVECFITRGPLLIDTLHRSVSPCNPFYPAIVHDASTASRIVSHLSFLYSDNLVYGIAKRMDMSDSFTVSRLRSYPFSNTSTPSIASVG